MRDFNDGSARAAYRDRVRPPREIATQVLRARETSRAFGGGRTRYGRGDVERAAVDGGAGNRYLQVPGIIKLQVRVINGAQSTKKATDVGRRRRASMPSDLPSMMISTA